MTCLLHIDKPAKQRVQITVYDMNNKFIVSRITRKNEAKFTLNSGQYNVTIKDANTDTMLIHFIIKDEE